MFTKISTISELKELFVQGLLNHCSEVTEISDNSVLNGVAFGTAKVAQKVLKEISLVEIHLMVDSAYGQYLDDIAEFMGVSARFGASESSTYVRLVGDPGTQYFIVTNTFTGSHGYTFVLEDDITIPAIGYTYAKVRSSDTGSKVNVDPLTLSTVTPEPVGHSYCINEYMATGGRDAEQDDIFRKRIKDGCNLAATGTLAKLTQVFIKINNNVLRVSYQGINETGQTVLAIATQNGVDLTAGELSDILEQAEQYLSLTDLRSYDVQIYGVELRNIEYQEIDWDFRVQLLNGYDPDEVRKEIQIAGSKYLDFRFWTYDKLVEWDELMEVVKNTGGVKYVPDQYFTPNADIQIVRGKLPRLKSFIMRDIDGNIISNISGTLNPVYYPNEPNISYQNTILASIT